ncbi:M23 family metallopeptidase [Nannocystis sp.]|uniref:M23 family metallopeptidase n=1 Tax=Nannocystis sp. TaxID=1962667 RepID=UPI0024239BBA|nr:M23 family metallopeptidase [Nannocystis sp.]MBK7824054.1 M23 family metallopeptidase [Nannocystis sp.]MBK9755068.1 M23 family metallopeptidase [Nannocystis sp.]
MLRAAVIVLGLSLPSCYGGSGELASGGGTQGSSSGAVTGSSGAVTSSSGAVTSSSGAASTSGGDLSESSGSTIAGSEGGVAASSGEGSSSGGAAECGCYAGDGPYCGHDVAAHVEAEGCEVAALAGHAGDILGCADGVWGVQEACAAGCESTAPGESDACTLPECVCFVKEAWCGSGAAKHGLGLDPPCRVPLVPEHNDDILGCDGDAWVVQQACAKGCHEEEVGVPDSCNDDSAYRLPYACDTAQTCSQGNFGSSHQGSQAYAWDFAMPKGTPVHAARAGKVAYLELRSPPGSPCYDPPGLLEQCHNKANFIGVRHADGTVGLYMHLREMKVKLGASVTQGQLIGLSGNTGYTSGPHLHFQLQNDCGIWFCSSVPVKFADAPKLAKGVKATSGNCP